MEFSGKLLKEFPEELLKKFPKELMKKFLEDRNFPLNLPGFPVETDERALGETSEIIRAVIQEKK